MPVLSCIFIPSHNEIAGYNGFTPSVGPSVPRPVSTLWRLHFWLDPFILYILSSNFRRCVKFFANFPNLIFWHFFKICNFDFVLFWLGIWCESLVWVIMGRRGVSQNAGVLVVLVSYHYCSISARWWRLPVIRHPPRVFSIDLTPVAGSHGRTSVLVRGIS